MSKKWIEPLRFDASVRVNGTAMTAADNMIEAANALEIATARIDAYTKELGGCRNAVGFGSADDPMAQEGFDALGDPLCVAAFVESQFKRIVAERDALAAELTALREQEPVAWYLDIEDWVREYNGLPEMSDGDIGTPLYARPIPARRLTDEMISHLYDQAGFDPNETREAADYFARAIESAMFGGKLQTTEGGDKK